jgi:hypothetical protein
MKAQSQAVLQVVQIIEQLQEVLADEELIDTAEPAVLSQFKSAMDNLDVAIVKLKHINKLQ